jgi:hypothetical protein
VRAKPLIICLQDRILRLCRTRNGDAHKDLNVPFVRG